MDTVPRGYSAQLKLGLISVEVVNGAERYYVQIVLQESRCCLVPRDKLAQDTPRPGSTKNRLGPEPVNRSRSVN